MSSTLLYLAIVAVWAVVLVPMWLRRDTDVSSFSRLLHKRPAPGEPLTEEHTLDEDTLHDTDEPPPSPAPESPRRNHHNAHPPTHHPYRGRVIARRRRRTFGLGLLLIASLVTVATALAPWWAALPALGLLAGHLSLLRVAVGMDAAQRHAEAVADRARTRAHEAALREAEEAAHHAEIIEFVIRTREVFDQYADDRRAVGD